MFLFIPCFADQLYPFGAAVGDDIVGFGIVDQNGTVSPPLMLSPAFRFFGRDEDTLYVNYIHIYSNVYCRYVTLPGCYLVAMQAS